MNRKEAEIGIDILRELSRKIDNKKSAAPRNGETGATKNDYDSSVLVGMIMPIDSHTSPEEGQGFF